MPNRCLRCEHGDDQNRQQVVHGCHSASSTNSNVEAGKSLPAGSAHSMRASAQVTAPGAATSMIVAVSTRTNRPEEEHMLAHVGQPALRGVWLAYALRHSER